MDKEFWQLLLNPQTFKNTFFISDDTPLCPKDTTVDNLVINLSLPLPALKGNSLNIISKSVKCINTNVTLGLFFYNKYNYESIFKKNRNIHPYVFSLQQIKRELISSGFKQIIIHAYYPEERKLVEITRLSQNRKISWRFREFIKSAFFRSNFFSYFQPAYVIVATRNVKAGDSFLKILTDKHSIRGAYDLICGKPNVGIVLSKDIVYRIPLDKLSVARSRICRGVVRGLRNTIMSPLVPALGIRGNIGHLFYYSEKKLDGTAIDRNIEKMDNLVEKAAELITSFHKETAKVIIINENLFKSILARDLMRLKPYLNQSYQDKLLKILDILRLKYLNKQLTLVWSHGDYKIENVLFYTKSWEISGVIDWDLSRKRGLPLLDIFFLLLYRDQLKTKNDILDNLRHRFLNGQFSNLENKIITKYIETLGLTPDYIEPMCIMFYAHHLTQRCQQMILSGSSAWMSNISAFIDSILSKHKAY